MVSKLTLEDDGRGVAGWGGQPRPRTRGEELQRARRPIPGPTAPGPARRGDPRPPRSGGGARRGRGGPPPAAAGAGGGQRAPAEEAGAMLECWIEADAFLRHMSRTLVGTMIDVAAGALSVE